MFPPLTFVVMFTVNRVVGRFAKTFPASSRRGLMYGFVCMFCAVAAGAQDAGHHHGGDPDVERPKIYLDKSEKIVAYQLKRLDNAKLLLVETRTDDPQYAPVFKAILLRSGLSRQNRRCVERSGGDQQI